MSVLERAIPADFSLYVRGPIGLLKKLSVKLDCYNANMVDGNAHVDNKELLIIPGASHTDLYDGGANEAIPWDTLESFYRQHL